MHCITIPISVYLCKLKKGRVYRIMDKKKIGSVIRCDDLTENEIIDALEFISK